MEVDLSIPVDLVAIGDIVRIAGCSRDRVAYVLRKLAIQPAARVGGVRVFVRGTLDPVLDELQRIERVRFPEPIAKG